MANLEMDYLIGLKQTALIRLKDLLICNSDKKTLIDAKESVNLINYNIESIKKKYGISLYNEKVGLNIPISQESPYSTFVAYKGPETENTEFNKKDYDYLLPKMKNNNGTSDFLKYSKNFSRKDQKNIQIIKGQDAIEMVQDYSQDNYDEYN
jgi:hypothetical protein